ncbi:hypothetical protein, partial [Roseicyclus sp.]|uniref:hypothetical protein n=1 Tax=Roseicyclus sp. TaxID=1914329 RepID=UPI001BCE450D
MREAFCLVRFGIGRLVRFGRDGLVRFGVQSVKTIGTQKKMGRSAKAEPSVEKLCIFLLWRALQQFTQSAPL